MRSNTREHSLVLLLLKLGCFLCLLGWTWTHLYWTGPVDVLLWQDSIFRVAEFFGIDWETFVGASADTGLIKLLLKVFGYSLLACAIAVLFIFKLQWWQQTVLLVSFSLLVLICYSLYIDSQRQLPMFVEHGGQMLMPIIFLAGLKWGIRHPIPVRIAIAAFIMTFAGHGLYAIGAWPTPGSFHAMTTLILGVEHSKVDLFLKLAGVMDFIICLGLFIPKIRIPSALYAALWGLATALARPVAGMSTELYYFGADQFLHETILRAPHFIIPLFLVMIWKKQDCSSREALHTDQNTTIST